MRPKVIEYLACCPEYSCPRCRQDGECPNCGMSYVECLRVIPRRHEDEVSVPVAEPRDTGGL